MTNDQFPSAGESFPGMIDPIIARRARPRNFEARTPRFPGVFANRSSRFSIFSEKKCVRVSQEDFRSFKSQVFYS